MATSATGWYWHMLAVLLGLMLSFEGHVPVTAAVNESQRTAKVNGRHGFREDMIEATGYELILSLEYGNM